MASDDAGSTTSVWTFRFDERGFLQLHREPELPSELEVPLIVVLNDAGQWPIDVRDYREVWVEHRQTQDPDLVCGNAACVAADGDEVHVQSVFDSWSKVSMPLLEFEAMLDAYYRYIVKRAGGENVDPEEGDFDDEPGTPERRLP